MPERLADNALGRLLDAGRAVMSELDVEAVLRRVVETAADITGARYAALGVLNEQRSGLDRFVTHGVSEAERRAIEELPRGRGVLGIVITDPAPLRVDALDQDPRACGFPPAHPPMHTFLGVPILIRGRAWGNLYLCDKATPFTDADEQAVVVLAEWAAIAVENARLYERSERRVRRLRATTEIARALGGETDLGRILELIAAHGRAFTGARGLLIALREGGRLVVAAWSGDVPPEMHGAELAGAGAALALAGEGGELVPLVFRGTALGLLVRLGPSANGDDDQLLRAFAASAAIAVATARTVEEQRLRDAMHAAEEERRRWARELHDDTLQGLGGLRMLLNAALRSDDPRPMLAQATERIEEEINALRGLIRELRPAALDELGVEAAIEGLAERIATRDRLDVKAEVRLATRRLAPELETALYRIVQEAATNAIRHAGAEHVAIDVSEGDGHVRLRIHDDGHGFDPGEPSEGFGLAGIRERVALLHGELEVASSPLGTTVTAALPVQ